MARNDDPRGTSHLRAAYVPWRLKIGLYPAYEAYLARFAQPSAALELGGADIPTVVDSNGQVVKDPSQVQAALLAAIKNYQAGGGMILPVGKMNMLDTSNTGDPYLKAFELVNQEIVRSIMLAELGQTGGKYGTKGLGEVHQDTEGLIVQLGKQVYVQCILERIVKPLVLYNYGEAGLQVLPKLSLGETEQQDFAAYAQAVTGLAGVGMITPHQYNDIFETLHLKPLPQEVINMMIQKWEAQNSAEVTMAQNPFGPPAPAEDDPEAIAAEEAQAASMW